MIVIFWGAYGCITAADELIGVVVAVGGGYGGAIV
jgi:hypothetical protein